MKKLNFTGIMMALGIVLLSLYSCSNELTIEMPKGPAGPAGASAYEVWVQAVEDGIIDWDKDRIDLNNYFLYLKGKNGAPGKDAYQLWLEEVAKGIDDPHNTGQPWPGDKTTIQDFWYFLTGAKGQDGSTPVIGGNGNWFIDGKDTGIPAKGKDGAPGKDGSVVTIGSNGNWLIDGKDTGIRAFGKDGAPGKDGSVVTIGGNGNWLIDGKDTGIPAKGENGVPGKDGSVVTIGSNGNWFIDGKDTGIPVRGDTGTQGQSAYELWVEEVKKGTLDDPHNPGQKWPSGKTTTQDFWEFLRGEDGRDGQAGGETGRPGEDIKIIPGKPNVIPQYVNQSYNEFVRWEDGGAGYIVYDNTGVPAAGAKVKGLPGVKDPDKEYTADTEGFFIVPKEDLPENEDISLRRGVTASVTYHGQATGEVSAPNTYVPNRMYVRLRSQNTPVINGTNMKFLPVIVERKTDGGAWQAIPSYLGDLRQRVIAYSLDNPNDPASYNESSAKYSVSYNTLSETDFDISLTTTPLNVHRLRKKAAYYPTPEDAWDGQEHYYTLVLDSYYGEKPRIDAVIKMAPVQAMPMIKSANAYGYNTGAGYFGRIEGELDITGTAIDNSLLFKETLKEEPKTTGGGLAYTYYSPEADDPGVYNNAEQFTVRFRTTTNSSYDSSPGISGPQFSLTTPYIESSVILECTSSYFYQLNTVGYLRFGTPGDLNTLAIVKRNDPRYVFSDIPVPYTPE
jgi:hypothetical protein